MTFYDQDGARRPSADAGGRPPEPPSADPYADPDIWAGTPVADAGGPRRPPRRLGGPRPGRPGAVLTEPTSVSVDAPVAAPPDDGHDYVDLGRESRLPRWIPVLVVLGLIAAVVGLGGRWWYQRQVDPPGPAGAAVSVQVPEGSSTSRIGDLMAARGVVSNSTLFNFYMDRKHAGPFQAGTYQMRQNSSFDEAIAQLEKGPGKPVTAQVTKVTIPEGFTVAKILARIHQKVPRIAVADMQAALDQGKIPTSLKPTGTSSYEGLLFPATYEVGSGTDGVQLLTMMAAEMEQRVGGLGIEAARAHIKQRWGLDLSAYDMVKVASMIQFEAAVPADAPKIAAVTYNRLQKGIPLGFDSTSIYEAAVKGTQPDYKVDSPYNTRLHTGLPPTPIAMPGAYALEGAMEPADGDWLYFVLTNTKEVTFSVTYSDFLQAKALCKQRGLGCG